MSWSLAPSAIVYNVYLAYAGNPYELIAATQGGNQATVGGLAAGQTYSFKVAAVDSSGVAVSSTASITAQTPTPIGGWTQGRVADPVTGNPIPGAKVVLSSYPEGCSANNSCTAKGTTETVFADSYGFFWGAISALRDNSTNMGVEIVAQVFDSSGNSLGRTDETLTGVQQGQTTNLGNPLVGGTSIQVGKLTIQDPQDIMGQTTSRI